MRGPTPIAIVNSPINVTKSAKPCAASPSARTETQPVQVSARPTTSATAITLSPVPAARCSYPCVTMPKWTDAAAM